jgi:serine protease Do
MSSVKHNHRPVAFPRLVKMVASVVNGLLMALLPPVASQAAGGAKSLQSNLTAAVQLSEASVVAIRTVTKSTTTGLPGHSVASGVIIDPAGIIVTNRHVVADAYSLKVILSDGVELFARVLGTTAVPDIAVLKVESDHPLPLAKFGDSDRLRIGETVFTIGNPLGLFGSATAGIVSGLFRNMNLTKFDNYIQMDTPINPGNSGGPLFNADGDIVGVTIGTAATAQGSVGLGLAIPSDSVRFVVNQILHYGRVRPGWIGVELQLLSPELGLAFGWGNRHAAIVTEVVKDGPAVGILEPGDIITGFSGQSVYDPRVLYHQVLVVPLGGRVSLTVWRGGIETTKDITVSEWPPGPDNPAGEWRAPDPGPRLSGPYLGMTLMTVDAKARAMLGLPAEQSGVAVIAVPLNSPASDAGFEADDVIVRIRDTAIASVADIMPEFGRAHDQRVSVPVLVKRGSTFLWLAVSLSMP